MESIQMNFFLTSDVLVDGKICGGAERYFPEIPWLQQSESH